MFIGIEKAEVHRNQITQLDIVEDEELLIAIATNHFRTIFESSNLKDIDEA